MKDEQATTITDKPFKGFGFAIRTCWVNGTNLSVWRQWSGDPLDPEKPTKLSTAISGNGMLEKDSVYVIGSGKQTNKFSLIIRSDEAAAEDWARIKEIEDIVAPHGDSTPELRIRKHIFERLDKNPPTAVLFFTRGDWEVGAKGGWSMECMLPSMVLKQLEEDLIAQRTQHIRLGIDWISGLVRDEHAPPSFPTTWGIFKLEEKGEPEPLRGHITSVSWTLSQLSVPEDHADDDNKKGQERLEENKFSEQLKVFGSVIATNIENFARTTKVAFALAFLLILVGYFLR